MEDGNIRTASDETLISLIPLICELQRDWARKEIQYEAP